MKLYNAAFIQQLESLGIPTRRYTGGTGIMWGPRWAADLVANWPSVWAAPINGIPEDESRALLERVVRMILRTGDAQLGPACQTVLQLSGFAAVDTMLEEVLARWDGKTP